MKKFLSVVMVLAMLAAFIVLPVNADNAVTTSEVVAPNTESTYVIGKDYATLKAAFAAAPTDGTTVTYSLSENVTYDSRLTVPAGTNIELDLAGYTLTYSGNVARANFYVNGTLAVTGEGAVINEASGYNAHVFAISSTGALAVTGNASFSAKDGDAIHNVGGTVASISAGTFTSKNASALNLANGASVTDITGGTFNGVYGIYAGGNTNVNAVTGGSFTGSKIGVYVKAGAKIAALSGASVSAGNEANYAICNLGEITSADVTVTSTGKGGVSNYGTIGTLNGSVTFTSATKGIGAAITNVGTITTLGANVEANAHGILNKGGSIETVSSKAITTVRGHGIYNKDGGLITTLNVTRVTASNRSAVYNSGEGTRIESINSGIFTATMEYEGSTDDRAIGISNMAGAYIGTINARRVISYGAAIANSASVINLITGNGDYKSQTVSISNVKYGLINEVTVASGRFSPSYDPEVLYGGYTVKNVGGSAHILVCAYLWNDSWTGAAQASSRQDFNVIRVSEEEYNALISESDVVKYYRDHDEKLSKITINYGTILKDSNLTFKSGDEEAYNKIKFFTYKEERIADGGSDGVGVGSVSYYFGIYAPTGIGSGDHSFELINKADHLIYKVTLTDVGPLSALDGEYPVYAFGDQMIHEYDPSNPYANYTQVSLSAAATVLVNGTFTGGWAASGFNTTRTDYNVIGISKDVYDALITDGATPKYFKSPDDAKTILTHTFDLKINGQTFVDGDQNAYNSVKFFTINFGDSYYLGFYAPEGYNATTDLKFTVANDSAKALYKVNISSINILTKPDGEYPVVAFGDQVITPFESVSVSAGARFPLFGWNTSIFEGRKFGDAPDAQFTMIDLTEEQFNALTGTAATEVHYVPFGATQTTADRDIYNYFNTNLDQGTLSGNTEYKFFTSKIVARANAESDAGSVYYRLGIYSTSAQPVVDSITYTAMGTDSTFTVTVTGMPALIATPEGTYPTAFYKASTEPQALVPVIESTKTIVDVAGAAKLPLFGGSGIDFPAGQWNEGYSQYFVINITEDMFNKLTPANQTVYRYHDHGAAAAENPKVSAVIDCYYTTVLENGTLSGDTQFKFFTMKTTDAEGGNVGYRLAVYCATETTVSSVTFKAETDDAIYNVSISEMAHMAATPEGARPLTYFKDQSLVFVESIAPAQEVSISGDAKLALFGGENIGFGTSQWNAGASQFFVIQLTEEQFNLLTPSDAVAKRYVNHDTTDADAKVDHYHYWENVLTGGTKSGDTQFNFFTAKLVTRENQATTYLLGVYSENETNVSAVNTTVLNGNLKVNVTFNGMARMAGTPAGTLPLAYFGNGQSLIACD